MAPYEKLEAWQLCHSLVLAVYAQTSKWPSSERFGLTSQVRRAAVSVTANIAEGTAKRGPRELRRYLDISIGSLSEVGYLLRLARDLEILSADQHAAVHAVHTRASQVTWKLYSGVSKAL